ncbi:hypothetical protein HanRHA438_Chr04g0193171 [Helianthus annuus]|nr:hypothetical protein HanHA89_Chr04g0163381 [Helianthus annuus]KAJ0758853.1 hypothetical protein HanLR1_Chr04g0154981 [Helianthus annuus]KAJ0762501.1 hypothetical protein HanOQP8_Chr04g0162051 [Helianthus annuus]KAJ0797573.1 hypothetical protein HanPI659440_Chr04g0175341 [Helianthus annuus]KAJ0928358.1 hypothetical protein HanRHA438_Chr04g0193171 [Helianthus annuus]
MLRVTNLTLFIQFSSSLQFHQNRAESIDIQEIVIAFSDRKLSGEIRAKENLIREADYSMRKSPKLQLSRWFSEINPYCYISLLPWITLASIDDVLASLVFGLFIICGIDQKSTH